LALRNNNGGFLLIGFKDDGRCLNDKVPSDVRATYHVDVIHEIITKFSSDPFEVGAHFLERDGHLRVMIEVDPGVKTPVLCHNDLPRSNTPTHEKAALLARNHLYVRTLRTNGRFSSACATAADWPQLMELCFNNREANIGAFIRRQLAGLDAASLLDGLQGLLSAAKGPTPVEAVDEYMNRCFGRYSERREKSPIPIPDVGVRETAAMIVGQFTPPELSREYMLMRLGRAPRLSGWSPWVGLLNVESSLGRVDYVDSGWESFEYVTVMFPSVDFSRIDSSGKFYALEGFRDDLTQHVPPKQYLEFVIETARVAETMATCLFFAKDFCGPESTNELCFGFRWRGLKGRRLSSWANPGRSFVTRDAAVQDELVTHVTIPIASAPDAIGLQVESVVKPLFRLFGGWEFESQVLQQIVADRILNHR
jgi:hypothetical protein